MNKYWIVQKLLEKNGDTTYESAKRFDKIEDAQAYAKKQARSASDYGVFGLEGSATMPETVIVYTPLSA